MRKIIIGLLLLNALIWGWTVAHAQTTENYADLSWVAPTESLTGERNAQGACITTPIPATGPEALAGFRIVYNTSLSALNVPPPDTDCGKTKYPDPTGVVINITNPATRGARIEPLPNGTYYFMVAAINQAGAISFFTGPVSKTINYVPPAVTFSSVTTDAYNVVKKNNGFVLVRIGTIPLNTLCDKTQSVNGHYAVPVSAITAWAGSARTIVAVAQCSEH